ncbi:uncharacterized protein [Dendropsophus ebraccatus]
MNTTARNLRNHTAALVGHTSLTTSPQATLQSTDVMADRQLYQLLSGIAYSLAVSKYKHAFSTVPLHIRSTEKLFVTVKAETDRSDVSLIIESCRLVSEMDKIKYYIIQNGCLDDRIVEDVLMEDRKTVFTLDLSEVTPISGSIAVTISCELKLCLNSNHSRPCSSSCTLELPSKQPEEPMLVAMSDHIEVPPIYVTRETRKKATTNYAAIVIGMVLGVTVLAVVVLLVRKSFSGVRRRNNLMDM